MYFSVCLRDLKFNGGLLRFKVILEIEFRFSLRISVFFGMPLESEIQRWLAAIQGYSGNQIRIFFRKVLYFLVCPRDLNFNGGELRPKVILEIEIRCLQEFLFCFCMPSGSEIQRWLVAIQSHSGN